MNSLLSKHKPANLTQQQWEAKWEAAADVLEPFAKMLIELKKNCRTVKGDDFSIPNHYQKLVWDLATEQTLQKLLDMMPKSIDKV